LRAFGRSLFNLMGFLIVLTAALILMQRFGMIDLGTGAVTVIDGDSLRKGETEIRLSGIDAPEYRQTCRNAQGLDYPCGKDAAAALRQMVRGRELTCSSIDTDRYGRAVSVCKIGSEDVGAAMVREGWAVAYTRHSISYLAQEHEARKAKRGIWAGSFERPEEYRARNRVVQGNVGPQEPDD
jgi:endonuclease YncB( thermonuclease family)